MHHTVLLSFHLVRSYPVFNLANSLTFISYKQIRRIVVPRPVTTLTLN